VVMVVRPTRPQMGMRGGERKLRGAQPADIPLEGGGVVLRIFRMAVSTRR
jgi:hypothetical protein